jgi:ATP synthase subunit 6
MFCVSGIPTVLIPFLAFIEILSYFFRFISLSLRLFANIVAGHILLETIYVFLFKSTFSDNSHSVLFLFLITIPSIFFILLILFEMVIACLQAYIFIVLCLIYLKDSLYLH